MDTENLHKPFNWHRPKKKNIYNSLLLLARAGKVLLSWSLGNLRFDVHYTNALSQVIAPQFE